MSTGGRSVVGRTDTGDVYMSDEEDSDTEDEHDIHDVGVAPVDVATPTPGRFWTDVTTPQVSAPATPHAQPAGEERNACDVRQMCGMYVC